MRALTLPLLLLVGACSAPESEPAPRYTFHAICGDTVLRFTASTLSSNDDTREPHLAIESYPDRYIIVARLPHTCAVTRLDTPTTRSR